MSRENVEIVRRIYEAVARDDAEAVLAAYDPGIEVDFSRSPFREMMDRRVYRGHDGLRSLFRERYEAWQTIEDDPIELIDVDERVVSVVTSRGRGRVSRVEVEQTHYGVWTIRSGKVARISWLGSRDEALDAAGLSA